MNEKRPQNGYSMKLISFMIALRKFIHPFNIGSLDEFFLAQNYRNANEISKMEFFKLVEYLQPILHLSPFDVNELFLELDDGWDFISTKKFKQIYDEVTSKVPFLPSVNNQFLKEQKENEAKKQQQQKERKNKIIRAGFQKLQAYMLENDAIALFDQCDEDFLGKLDPKEFNNLLICTALREFEDKEIRKIVIAQIYSYFPSKKITKEDYIKLFKIPKQKVKPKQKPRVDFFVPQQKVIPFYYPEKKEQPKQNPNQTVDEKKIPSQPNIQINIKLPENKNKTIDANNDGFKKKKVFQEEEKLGPIKQDKKEQIIEGREICPQASVYYRNGQPIVEQLQYLQELEILLKLSKIYTDKKNPHTPKGQYMEARNFFNGMNYQLFQMAQSVLQREKSRIGLAREIEPKDIIQGELGDCYFLSSIASLISIYPEVISEKFLFNANPANYFAVKLFLNGEWKYITTDDYFPTSNKKDPCFAKPHGKEIWVMLLEKCWAKCFESYQRIVSGNSKEAFAALTGAPTEYFSLKSKQMTKQTIQQKIKEAYQSRYVVTASGSDYLDSLSEAQQEKIGLVSGHAYSFLKFIDANGNPLVKIRNPWGSRVWKGDWSFESTKWSKILRDKFNYNRSPDDGSFYMSMQDFLKFFGSFVICKVNPINMHTSLKLSFKRHKSNYVKMKVSQSGRYMLSLYQENQREMKIKYSNFKFSPARLIIMKMGKKWEYIDSYQDSGSYSTSIEVDLEEGCEYIVSGKYEWVFWQEHQGCLTAYGPDKVVLEQIDRSIAPEFKREMIEGFFKKNRGKTKDYNKTGAVGSQSESLFSLDKGIGYYFITNPHEKSFDLTYSMKGSGIKVIKPEKLPFKFEMTKGARFLKGFFTSSNGFNYESSESLSYY